MYNIDDQYQDIALFRITCQFIIEMLNYRGKNAYILYTSPFVRPTFTSYLQFRPTKTNVCLDKANSRRREHSSERNDTYQESNNHFVGQVKACNDGIDMFDKKIGPAIYSHKYVAKKSICRVQKKIYDQSNKT